MPALLPYLKSLYIVDNECHTVPLITRSFLSPFCWFVNWFRFTDNVTFVVLHLWFMLCVQRNAEGASSPTEGHIQPPRASWKSTEGPFTLLQPEESELQAAPYWLGSSFTEAHESIGRTWDSHCQRDSSQPHKVWVSVTAPCCEAGAPLPQL